MKKIGLACLCLLLLVGCSNGETRGEVKEITISKVIKKMNDKDDFVLLVSRDSCAHCQKLEESLATTIKEHNTVIYNVKLNETSYDTLVKDAKELEKYLNEPGTTPHVYSIKNGKEVDGYEGYSESQPNQFWDFIAENKLENAE